MKRFAMGVLVLLTFSVQAQNFRQDSSSSLITRQQAVNPMTDAQVLERGRKLVLDFYAVKLEPLFELFTPDLQVRTGGLEAFRNYRLMGIEVYGQELEMLEEEVITQDNVKGYVRTAVFEKRPNLVWYVICAFDETGAVAYFNIEYAGSR
jgi:hypothetical protein